jgi:tellurite methyltransferase
MNRAQRERWEERYRGAVAGAAEPSVVEMLPMLPPGIALDVAAGIGRNSIALARAGIRVVAVDFSETAMRALREIADSDNLRIMPVISDLEDGLPFRPRSFDAVINVTFLDRALVPLLKNALRTGGLLLFDTFLIDQAEIGHPCDPRFLLRHYELREHLADMELLRYREGIVTYANDKPAWRAAALARRRT